MSRVVRRGRRAAGALKNWALNLICPPVVVLAYHRVVTLSSDPQMLAVSPDNFRRQMAALRDAYPVLRAEDDWSSVREPSVVVTFDDGYADNVREALPVLEEYRIPAAFFITTGYTGAGREFWWDELERLVLLSPRFPSWFKLKHEGRVKRWPAATGEERHILYSDLHRIMKKVDAPLREEWIGQIRGLGGMGARGRPSHRAMSVEELKSLVKSPLVTIGAHTVTHTPLSAQGPVRQREEVRRSKHSLESWLGREIRVFSYPFGGREHYTAETVRLVREAGFVRAFSNFPGQWRRGADPFQIPRQLVRDWDDNTFRKMLKRFWLL